MTGIGANLIIIDDPLKVTDAYSEAERNRVNEWYDQAIYSRLDNKKEDRIVIVMQRLHENDLIGHLLEKDGWDILELPAIAEEDQEIEIGTDVTHVRNRGEALHPQREDLDTLESIRQTIGSMTFAAHYQQRPVPAEGNMILRSWLKRYDKDLPLEHFEMIVQSWDVGLKAGAQNDFSVCTTWGIKDLHFYVLDCLRCKREIPELATLVQERANQYKAKMVIIEDAGPGTAIIQCLRYDAPYMPIVPFRVKGSKEVRVAEALVLIERGQVLFPTDAPWLGVLESELLAFPMVVTMTRLIVSPSF